MKQWSKALFSVQSRVLEDDGIYKAKREAAEIDAMRRFFCISRRNKIRNKIIKQGMEIEGRAMKDIDITWQVIQLLNEDYLNKC